MVYGNPAMMDVPVPTYPSSIHTNPSYPLPPHDGVPIFMNSHSENTIFMTPNVDYLIPVTAIHNCKCESSHE